MSRRSHTPAALKRLVNWYPPFLFSGIRLLQLAPDWSHARVRLKSGRLNRNYVGTHFGGSLFAMCDPFWMIMLMERLGRDYIVWDKAGEIDFVKALREPVYADFRLTQERVEAIGRRADAGERVLEWFETDVASDSGVLAARFRKQIYVRRKTPT